MPFWGKEVEGHGHQIQNSVCSGIKCTAEWADEQIVMWFSNCKLVESSNQVYKCLVTLWRQEVKGQGHRTKSLIHWLKDGRNFKLQRRIPCRPSRLYILFISIILMIIIKPQCPNEHKSFVLLSVLAPKVKSQGPNMPTFIWLSETSKIHYLEKLHRNLTSNFQVISNFLMPKVTALSRTSMKMSSKSMQFYSLLWHLFLPNYINSICD